MIEPSKVSKAFSRVEKENYDFRAFLKNHADEDKLLNQNQKLTKAGQRPL